MGRPRKIIDGQEETEIEGQEEIQAEGQEEAEIELSGENDAVVDTEKLEKYVAALGRRAYIKNGVTILRYPADEAALLGQGWVKK